MPKQTINQSSTNRAKTSKKWQKMFRYTAEREKATKELAEFAQIVHGFSKNITYSPDSISDNSAGKIYI